MKFSKYAFSSAIEVANAIKFGSITSLELTELIITRIKKYNSSLNAIVTLVRKQALKRAKNADKALERGQYWGPLHGVPITIKDTFDTQGIRTTAGSPSLSDNMPVEDAIPVTRLKNAGAIIIGHTNVPIMAGDWQSYNELFGTTKNPWDLNRTPGGSTGGGAAAIAAGLSFLSLGSDVGGSIRIPAHFCGVYGHKPTINFVSGIGHTPKSPNCPSLLWVYGPLARSPQDLRLALEIIGGPEPENAIAYSWKLPQERGEDLSDYRLGFVWDNAECPVTPEVKDVLEEVIKTVENKTASIEEGWPKEFDPKKAYDNYRFYLASEYASFLRDKEFEQMKKRSSELDVTYSVIRAKAWTVPHKYYQYAAQERLKDRAQWSNYFKNHDAFLLPVSFLPAFPHDHSQPAMDRILQTSLGQRKYDEIMFWISHASLMGLPATVAPIGFTRDGLPVGIQIIGPYSEDATTIHVASKITELLGGFKPPKYYV
jgi:amidase